jgi:hypothetical protein
LRKLCGNMVGTLWKPMKLVVDFQSTLYGAIFSTCFPQSKGLIFHNRKLIFPQLRARFSKSPIFHNYCKSPIFHNQESDFPQVRT